MTTRRGLLGYLAALGVVALAPTITKAAVLGKGILPPGADSFDTHTFKREPGFFDISTYTGNGASATIPHTLGPSLGFVMIKCRSKVGDWHMVELDDAVPVLPAKFNEDGHSYTVYQFGKKAIPQIQPYIDQLKRMKA